MTHFPSLFFYHDYDSRSWESSHILWWIIRSFCLCFSVVLTTEGEGQVQDWTFKEIILVICEGMTCQSHLMDCLQIDWKLSKFWLVYKRNCENARIIRRKIRHRRVFFHLCAWCISPLPPLLPLVTRLVIAVLFTFCHGDPSSAYASHRLRCGLSLQTRNLPGKISMNEWMDSNEWMNEKTMKVKVANVPRFYMSCALFHFKYLPVVRQHNREEDVEFLSSSYTTRIHILFLSFHTFYGWKCSLQVTHFIQCWGLECTSFFACATCV